MDLDPDCPLDILILYAFSEEKIKFSLLYKMHYRPESINTKQVFYWQNKKIIQDFNAHMWIDHWGSDCHLAGPLNDMQDRNNFIDLANHFRTPEKIRLLTRPDHELSNEWKTIYWEVANSQESFSHWSMATRS